MDQDQAPLPHRMQPHFCRECGKRFDTNTESSGSPHGQTWRHKIRDHSIQVTGDMGCGHHCMQREQPEEAEQGRRLYGKGVAGPSLEVRTALREQYNGLFPPEES